MKTYTKVALVMCSLVVGADVWIVKSAVASKTASEESTRAQAWEQGYMVGAKQALDASQEQFRILSQSGKLDPALMIRNATAGLTNNPYKK